MGICNVCASLNFRFQMSVIFRLAYGRRLKDLQDEAAQAKIQAGNCEPFRRHSI